jgi:hypothetical protein
MTASSKRGDISRLGSRKQFARVRPKRLAPGFIGGLTPVLLDPK